MVDDLELSPAHKAAKRALNEMYACIRARRNFRLEAGAGAGKTYSLVQALQKIIKEEGLLLQRNKQKVACITYTNVATEEIISRTDGHPVIFSSTIHSFCWELIKGFQPNLRTLIKSMDVWSDKLEEIDGIGIQQIDYELGYRSVNETHLYLHHDDVLSLTVELMKEKKFRKIFFSKFPILFIDEYQDTNKDFANCILEYFISENQGPLVGLFGDSWQKIYGDGSGLVEHENLQYIGKEANFRSAPVIVKSLNSLRPELPQEYKNPEELGDVSVYHSNTWAGVRRSGSHWAGDLPPESGHAYLDHLRDVLEGQDWDFSPDKTKILMLTHKVLSTEQNYEGIVNVFRYNDSFLKKENSHIEFLVDTVEPACLAFINGKYGEMFDVVGLRSGSIRSSKDKKAWSSDMHSLLDIRERGTIGEVLDLLKNTKRPRLPEKVQNIENELKDAEQEEIDNSTKLTQIQKLRAVRYSEIIALADFVNEHTVFSTKHGVKGAQFENVLVVLGRGWNKYNWNQFLEWFNDGVPVGKVDAFERNRNLFYVACSRAKKRLSLLFTQELSDSSLSALSTIFGEGNVNSLEL